MKTLIFFILGLAFVACSNPVGKSKKFSSEQVASLGLDSTKIIQIQKDSIIEINLNPFLKEDSLKIGELIKTIKFLPLETTDKSLISEIDDIVVTDSNIYVSDNYKGGSLLIYDKTGKFINRILRGPGPEEILELKSFAFDRVKRELIIFHSNRLSFYSSNGIFIRKEILPFYAFYITVIPDGYLFRNALGTDNRHMGYSEHYQIFITNEKFKLESIGVPYLYSRENIYEGKKYISLSGSDINLTFKFNDTIYQYVDKNTIKAKFSLNMRNKRIPENVIKELPVREFFKVVENNNYYFFMGKYIENSTNNFFELVNWYIKDKTFIFRDKKSGNILGGNILITNASDFPFIKSPVTSYESYYVSYFLPENMAILKEIILHSTLLSEEDRTILKNVEDEDNPVLVFYELKDF